LYEELEEDDDGFNDGEMDEKQEKEIDKDLDIALPLKSTANDLATLLCDTDKDCIDSNLQVIKQVKKEEKEESNGVKHQVELSMGVEISTLCPFCAHIQTSTKCSPLKECSGVFGTLARVIYERNGISKKGRKYLPVKQWFDKIDKASGLEPLLPSDSVASDDTGAVSWVNCAASTGGGMTFGVGLAAPIPHFKIAITCDVAITDIVKSVFKEMGAAVNMIGEEADSFQGSDLDAKGGFWCNSAEKSQFLQLASKAVPWKSSASHKALQP